MAQKDSLVVQKVLAYVYGSVCCLVVQKERKKWLQTLAPPEVVQKVLAYIVGKAQLKLKWDVLRNWRWSIEKKKSRKFLRQTSNPSSGESSSDNEDVLDVFHGVFQRPI